MIVSYPNSILSEKCVEVVPGSIDTRQIADELCRTLRTHRRRGIGLAAPQIGYAKRVFVLNGELLKCPSVFVNPEASGEDEATDTRKEGCLSFPDTISIPVRRRLRINIVANDIDGNVFVAELSGLAARCALHEMDHLDGVTILDHASKPQRRDALKKIVAAVKRKK